MNITVCHSQRGMPEQFRDAHGGGSVIDQQRRESMTERMETVSDNPPLPVLEVLRIFFGMNP